MLDAVAACVARKLSMSLVSQDFSLVVSSFSGNFAFA